MQVRRVRRSPGVVGVSSVRQARSSSTSGTRNWSCSHQPLMRMRKSSSSRACRPRPGRGVVAVEVDGRTPARVGPVLGGHGLGRGREPGQLGRLHPDEEAAPAEHRVLASQRDQASGEGQQLVVGLGPVEPGDGVVLAVGVVVTPGWPSSSPPHSSGTPNDSSRVVSSARDCRARSSTTSGSSLGPSTPQFQDRLSSVPSRLASPLASLCLAS